MKFLQHFLPGTPVEENNHSSLGLIFKRLFKSENFSVTSGFQIELADADAAIKSLNLLSFRPEPFSLIISSSCLVFQRIVLLN